MRKYLLLLFTLSILSKAYDGELDPSFGPAHNGTIMANFDDYEDNNQANAVLIQGDGKVVAAGYVGGPSTFGVARYLNNGTLDTSFSQQDKPAGLARTDFGIEGTFSVANAAVLDTKGKIVVVGYLGSNEFPNLFALARYNQDGTLDISFNPQGIQSKPGTVVTKFAGSPASQATAVALSADGKIIVAGSSDDSASLARYHMDGSPDASFNANGQQPGTLITDLIGFNPVDVVVQQDSKIVLLTSTTEEFFIARYNKDGTLDQSFGVQGQVRSNFGGTGSYASKIVLQHDGSFVVAGHTILNKTVFALARYVSNGTLDTSFGTQGITLTDFTGWDGSSANAVAVQKDGKIIAAGEAHVTYGIMAFALARYFNNGSLDTTFNPQGRNLGKPGTVTTEFAGENQELSTAYSIAIENDGKIVAGGSNQAVYGRGSFALARYLGSTTRKTTSRNN